MADVLFVAVAIAFFGLAALYVTACDRLIGREEVGGRNAKPVVEDREPAARP